VPSAGNVSNLDGLPDFNNGQPVPSAFVQMARTLHFGINVFQFSTRLMGLLSSNSTVLTRKRLPSELASKGRSQKVNPAFVALKSGLWVPISTSSPLRVTGTSLIYPSALL